VTGSEGAIQRLYDDPRWREDLNDAEAGALLKWAEARLNQPEAQAAGSPESRVEELHTLLKRINRLIGKRDQLSQEEQQRILDDLAQSMEVMPITPAALSGGGLRSQTAAADFLPLIGALTTWMDGGELPSAPVDDARADTGAESKFDEFRAQMSGIAAGITAPEPPAPPAAPDPNLSAILGFFNTAPDESDSEHSPSDEDVDADTP